MSRNIDRQSPAFKQRMAQLITGYGPIHLYRDGDYAVVLVEALPGKWIEVIREHVDGNFSHIVEPLGIEERFREENIGLCKP